MRVPVDQLGESIGDSFPYLGIGIFITMAVGSHSKFFCQEIGMMICVFLKDFSEWSMKTVRGR